MIEGLFLGFMSWLSLMFTWSHLPNWLKRFTIKRFVFTDLITTALTWILIGSLSHSLVALIASMSSGLFMNFTMLGFKKGLFPTPGNERKNNGTDKLQRVD